MKYSSSISVAAPNGLDLIQVQLPGQDDSLKTHLFQKGRPLRCVVVHLGAGDQGQGRQVAFQQAGVLDDQAVDADPVQFVNQVEGSSGISWSNKSVFRVI